MAKTSKVKLNNSYVQFIKTISLLTCTRIKPEPYLSTYTKLKSKWIILKIYENFMELPEENKGDIFRTLEWVRIF